MEPEDWRRPQLLVAQALTCPAQALDRGGEALGARQQVVLEGWQPLGGGHLHADAVLLLCEACALTVQEKLGHRHRDAGSDASRARASLPAEKCLPPERRKDSTTPLTSTWRVLGPQSAHRSHKPPHHTANSTALTLRECNRELSRKEDT